MKPEAQARTEIDRQLQEAGWVVQDRSGLNLAAGPGVAVREFLSLVGPSDYVLFVDGIAVAGVSARRAQAACPPRARPAPRFG